jgi:hypothetical protein
MHFVEQREKQVARRPHLLHVECKLLALHQRLQQPRFARTLRSKDQHGFSIPGLALEAAQFLFAFDAAPVPKGRLAWPIHLSLSLT